MMYGVFKRDEHARLARGRTYGGVRWFAAASGPARLHQCPHGAGAVGTPNSAEVW